jgi:TonB family protein
LSLTAILWPVVIVTALLVFDQWPNWSRRTSAQFAGWFEAAHARTGKFLASRIQAPASSNEPASQHVAFAITDDLLSDYASPTRAGPDAGAVLANGPKDIDVGSVEMLPSSTRVMAPVFTVDDIRPKLEIPASLRFPPPEHPAGITPGGHLVAVDWNQAPIALPEAVSRALLEHQVAPQYPDQALRTGADGPVVFVASIGKDGAVRELKLVSGYLVLAHAAVDAVKQWRYKPYRRNGENVEIETLITVNFKRPPRG